MRKDDLLGPSGLSHTDDKVREQAAKNLGQSSIIFDNDIRAALYTKLSDPIRTVRIAAAETLHKKGENDSRILTEIFNCLEFRGSNPDERRGDHVVRKKAATALASFVNDSSTSEIISRLEIARREDANEEVRREAAKSLEWLVGPASPAPAAGAGAGAGANEEVRREAARSLERLVGPASPAPAAGAGAGAGAGAISSRVIVSHDKSIAEIPGDGSCLYSAIVLGFLLPVLHDDTSFVLRYKNLFDNEADEAVITELKDYLRDYDGTSSFLGNSPLFGKLVETQFRVKVVSLMREKLKHYRNIYNEHEEGTVKLDEAAFNKYLDRQAQARTWGGPAEIVAIQEMLDIRIGIYRVSDGARVPHVPVPEGNSPLVELMYTGIGGNNNHYNLLLDSHLLSRRINSSALNKSSTTSTPQVDDSIFDAVAGHTEQINRIDVLLVELATILSEVAIGFVREELRYFGKPAVSFKYYVGLQEIYNNSESLFAQLFVNLKSKEHAETYSKLRELRVLINILYLKKCMEFVDYLLANESDLQKLLFGGVALTSEAINKRFRELSSYFYPERKPFKTASIEDQQKAEDLFQALNGLKERLLENQYQGLTDQESVLKRYVQIAYDYYREALKYKSLAKQRTGMANAEDAKRLQNLTGDFTHYRLGDLESHKINNALQSAAYYHAAIGIVDQQSRRNHSAAGDDSTLLNLRIEYRRLIAIVFYLAGAKVEAQLYLLSGMRLTSSLDVSLGQKAFNSLQQVMHHIYGTARAVSVDTPAATANEVVDLPPCTALALIPRAGTLTTTKGRTVAFNSHEARQAIREAVANDINTLLIRSDRQLAKYNAATEEIIQAQKSSRAYTVAAGVVGLVAPVLGAGALVTGIVGGVEVMQIIGVAAALGSLAGPVGTAVGVVAGAIIAGLGLFLGWRFFKIGSQLADEPQLREDLNKQINEAIEHYRHGRMTDFLATLGRPYGALPEDQLYKFERGIRSGLYGDDISRAIIKKLKKHGFRPDGIAYILLILAEALLNLDSKLTVEPPSDCQLIAINILRAVESEELTAAAATLDESIQKAFSESQGFFMRRFYETYTRLYYGVPASYFTEYVESPFGSRLEEVRNIARLNHAIARMKNNSDAELELAAEQVRIVKQSVERNHQYFSIAAHRLHALEDFLSALGSHTIQEPETTSSTSALFLHDHPPAPREIRLLREQIRVATDSKEKARLYSEIARIHVTEAIEKGRTNYVNSLLAWKEAEKNYILALEQDQESIVACLGRAECLINLCKFNRAWIFLKPRESLLRDQADYWYWISLAARKQHNYNDAAYVLNKGLALNSTDPKLVTQKVINDHLRAQKPAVYVEHYKSVKIDVNEGHYVYSQRRDNKFYTIVSVDGGGVRGIMPAIWLAEIESRAHRPMAHLVNMLAGTSTGSLIAAGLSVAQPGSKYVPHYSAASLVSLYRTENISIFTRSIGNTISSFFGLMGPSYTADGRERILREHFTDSTLKDCLTDVVITAADQDHQNTTKLFNRFEAKKTASHNYSLFDAVMASTAAPTFFPAHRIESHVYVDGGIQANNPAELAVNEARRYGVDNRKIRIWSLGTGDCVSDPTNPGLNQGKLYWAANLHRNVLGAQQGNADRNLSSAFPTRYQRWQVWLENPVAMDDCSPESTDTLIEYARIFIEEMDADESNLLNRTVEALLQNEELDDSTVMERASNRNSLFAAGLFGTHVPESGPRAGAGIRGARVGVGPAAGR